MKTNHQVKPVGKKSKWAWIPEVGESESHLNAICIV